MANIIPNLSQPDLLKLCKLLRGYEKHIHGEQLLAADIIRNVRYWAERDLDDANAEALSNWERVQRRK